MIGWFSCVGQAVVGIEMMGIWAVYSMRWSTDPVLVDLHQCAAAAEQSGCNQMQDERLCCIDVWRPAEGKSPQIHAIPATHGNMQSIYWIHNNIYNDKMTFLLHTTFSSSFRLFPWSFTQSHSLPIRNFLSLYFAYIPPLLAAFPQYSPSFSLSPPLKKVLNKFHLRHSLIHSFIHRSHSDD